MLFLIHFRFTQFLGLALWVGQLGAERSVQDKHFLEVGGVGCRFIEKAYVNV